tara:strand:- start:944 stop:1591 length:648 start_codon:yes stop_codon:yes gene_type:complete
MDYYSSYKKVIMPRISDSEIFKRIDTLKQQHDISPNAYSFLSSLAVAYKKYGGVTQKQYKAFCDIEKSYLNNNKEPNTYWVESYGDIHRETAKICALYYCANPPYYGDLAFRVLYDKAFLPTEKQYEALTENKYAQKVLESHYSEPKFKVNDYVSLRKNNPCGIREGRNIFIIIQIAPEPITTAAKNTKKYKLLPIDNTKTYVVEERWLKFSNRK